MTMKVAIAGIHTLRANVHVDFGFGASVAIGSLPFQRAATWVARSFCVREVIGESG